MVRVPRGPVGLRTDTTCGTARERSTMDVKSPTWQDAVECGCEEEWLDAYNSQFDG